MQVQILKSKYESALRVWSDGVVPTYLGTL